MGLQVLHLKLASPVRFPLRSDVVNQSTGLEISGRFATWRVSCALTCRLNDAEEKD